MIDRVNETDDRLLAQHLVSLYLDDKPKHLYNDTIVILR